jgi:ABC-type glutathione transport system ATPase component
MSGELEARDIVKTFNARREGRKRTIHAVNHVTVSVAPGEIVGLVGESGSGKTTLSRVMIGIERETSGVVLYDGIPVTSPAEWRALRRHVQYVFQDPFTALCPTMRIGDALAEPLIIHKIGARAERSERVARIAQNRRWRPGR